MSDIAIYVICLFAAFVVYLICDAVKDAIKSVNKEDKRDETTNKRDKGLY